jgi:hypothetical protein
VVDTAVLDRIREFRIAARHAVESTDAGDKQQLLALMDLADLVRREPDRTTRLWAERVIWAEAASFILEEEPPIFGDRWERAQRELRLGGYEKCPRCLSQVQTLEQLDREQRRRLERIQEHERKLEAVDRG